MMSGSPVLQNTADYFVFWPQFVVKSLQPVEIR
jgi:hypothetical protein